MSIRGRVEFDDGVIASGDIDPSEAADLTAIVTEAACARGGIRFEEPAFVSYACEDGDLHDGIDHEGVAFDDADEEILKRIRRLVRPRKNEGSLGAAAFIPNRALHVILEEPGSATLAAAALDTLPSRLDRVEAATGLRPVAKKTD